MSGTVVVLIVIFVFICINGFFAIAEMALVSLRENKVKELSDRGRRGRTVAKLTGDPNRYLAAVQIGVTLAGFFSAAFGGAKLADKLAPVFDSWGLATGVADIVALVVITLVIAYVSLVIGELAPKRIGLQRSAGVSLVVAPVVDGVATLARPVIWLLGVSTNLVVRVLGGDPHANREEYTEAEIRDLVVGAESLGAEERQIVEDVFEAGDRQIREVMVPRTEADFLDGDTPAYKAARMALERPHSRYPVIGDSADDILGFVHVRDLLDPDLAGRSVRVKEFVRDVLMLPDTRNILSALTDMRAEGGHIAIVVDEYGGTAGVVTMEDIVEELVGDIKDEYDVEESETTRTLAGEVEVDGLLNLDDFEDETGLVLPDGPYETVAGYVMQQLGHVPQVGETARFDGHMLTVSEVDGRRVSRVRVHAAPPDPAEESDADRPLST